MQTQLKNNVLGTDTFKVPMVCQSSALGPVLFTLYSQPLSGVVSDHDCDYHKYADDTELSKDASPDQFDSVQSCIQTCISDVLIWMNSNKLKLNTIKQRLCLLVLHLLSLWLRVSAQTSVETVFLPIAISNCLYLRIFLHLSAPKSYPGLSDLPKKSYSKSPSET